MIERFQKYLLPGIIAGAVIGALTGIFAPSSAVRVKIVGDLFMRALFMLVVPLIIVSIVTGVTSLGDVRKLGGLGGRTLLYYIATTCLSVLTGIIIVNIIRPGAGLERKEDNFPEARYQIVPRSISGGSELILVDQSRFHNTHYGSGFAVELVDQGVEGVIDPHTPMTPHSAGVSRWTDSEGNTVEPMVAGDGVKIVRKAKPFRVKDLLMTFIPKNIFKSMAEMEVLPLIVFSLFFGGILTTLGEKGRRVIEVFEGLNEAIMTFVRLVMLAAPIGIFALVAARLGKAQLDIEGGFIGELSRLGMFALTVITSLSIHAFITLPLVFRLITRRKAGRYARNLSPALFTAFSTASSAATLPLTMENMVEKNGVSEETASFVLPLGATVNMDGTALYEAVSALFIAQVYAVHLTPAQQVVVFFTAVLAGVGAAAIPEAGLVTMVMVLTAVGLPVDGIAILLTIDWFLDRCRTTVNVWGDAVGAGVIDHLEGKSPPIGEG